MSKEVLVFILGIALAVMPYLGLPPTWKAYLTTGAGVFLIFLGYALRRAAFLRRIEDTDGHRRADSFVEKRHDSDTK